MTHFRAYAAGRLPTLPAGVRNTGPSIGHEASVRTTLVAHKLDLRRTVPDYDCSDRGDRKQRARCSQRSKLCTRPTFVCSSAILKGEVSLGWQSLPLRSIGNCIALDQP